MKKALAVLVALLVVFSAGCIGIEGMTVAKFVRATNSIHSADYSLNLSMVASIRSPLLNTTVRQFIHATGAFDRVRHLQTGNASMISHTASGRRVLNLTFFQNGSMMYIKVGGTWFKFRANKNQSAGISNVSALFKFLSKIAKNGTIKRTSTGYVFRAPLTNSSLREMVKLGLLTITRENVTAKVKVNGGFIEAKLRKDGTPYWIHELINVTLMESGANVKVELNPVFNITFGLSNINSAKVIPPQGIENAVPAAPSAIRAFRSSLPPLNKKLLIGTESMTKYEVWMDEDLSAISFFTSSVRVHALVDENSEVALVNVSANNALKNISVYINGSKLEILSGSATMTSASHFMGYATMAKRLLETALKHSNLTVSMVGDHYTVRGSVSSWAIMNAINIKVTGASVRAILVANFTKEYRPVSYVLKLESSLGPILTVKARFKELPADFKITPHGRD